MNDLSDRELLDALGVTVEPKKKTSASPEEGRVVAAFEEILRFAEEHGRAPEHGEDRDIFERIYAARLDRIRASTAYRDLVSHLDTKGLLGAFRGVAEERAAYDDEALLRELGVEPDEEADDIGTLRHVRSHEERRAAEEIASRAACPDFPKFKPLFDQVRSDLADNIRQTRPFELKSEIEPGRFFVVSGQIAYVAEKEPEFTNDQGRRDARLRVIFDNGTESNMLMRSLQRSLHKDEAGRRITEPTAGPLFGAEAEDGDSESGTIYVLRSKSDHPTIAASRQVIHKIGVTGGEVAARVAAAPLDPTYLMAGVDVIATYKLFNINRQKLEHTLHRFFSGARLDLEIIDRFGRPVKAKEWFLVPLPAIDEAVQRIIDDTIDEYIYDAETASLMHVIQS